MLSSSLSQLNSTYIVINKITIPITKTDRVSIENCDKADSLLHSKLYYIKHIMLSNIDDPFLPQILQCEENLQKYHEGSKITLSKAGRQSLQS